ncbi:MAG TPA: exonuclease domain-containing protein [Burkholderiales bacterium]|nr:exonuclease domain-containing protein [Burkholderiales bacterium]
MIAVPRARFVAVWFACFALLAAAAAGALFLVHAALAPDQKRAFARMLEAGGNDLFVLGVILLVVSGFVAAGLVRVFLVPVGRLAESTRLIAAGNPAYRAAFEGPAEVRALALAVNALADRHEISANNVQEQIRQARADLDDEKSRLAALMSELASGVVVCTVEGRILLYNEHARQIFSGTDVPGFIGLGRSLFSLLDRHLVVHALDQLRHRVADGELRPVSVFLASPGPELLLRVRMAPVMGATGGPGEPSGFLLLMDDVGGEVALFEQRDLLLEQLIQSARAALGSIRAAAENLESFPQMGPERQAQFAAIISAEAHRLTAHLERATRGHSDLVRSLWSPEHMRAADLVAVARRRIQEHLGLATATGEIDESLWVSADSYAMVQALSYVVRRVRDELDGSDVYFHATQSGRYARIDVQWMRGRSPGAGTTDWETDPLTTGGEASPLTLREVLGRHRAEAWCEDGAGGAGGRFRMLLPLMEPVRAFHAPLQPSRPEYYDFDLFSQPGSERELDDRKLTELAYTAFDTETTGLEPGSGDEIISIGAVRLLNGRVLAAETFDRLVDPRRPLNAASAKIHGISAEMLAGQPTIDKVLPAFHQFCEDTVLVGHNAAFDMRFLQLKEAATGLHFTQPVLDTLLLSAVLHRDLGEHQLETIAARLGVSVTGRHTALGDAMLTGEIFLRMIPLLAERGIVTLRQAREASQRTFHARIRY